MRNRFVLLGNVASVLALIASPLAAGTIGLTWNSAQGASGYRVYYGSSAGSYFAQPLYEGPSTSVEITDNDLEGCQTWHFVVTAYNGAGESDPSVPVSSWTRPLIDSSTPTVAMQGDTVVLTVAGESFDPSGMLVINNANIRLDNPFATCDGSCNCEYQVVATVEPTASGVQPAQIGTFDITVANPTGLVDTDAFQVLLDNERFDVNTSVPTTVDRIDGMDTAWLSKSFGTRIGDATYDPDYDFDGDGWVDGVDLAYIGSNFGECWNGNSWDASAC